MRDMAWYAWIVNRLGLRTDSLIMEDSDCWFPLPAMRECVRQRRIGRLARRFHGAPSNRSQRHTLGVDCPEILRRCQEDDVYVAVLVPNCPICHQTLSLVARC